MVRRFGCWTLLIASALWAQGCAHAPIESSNSSISDVHKALQGTWKCHAEVSLDKNVVSYIDSITTITPTQKIEKGTIRIEDRTDTPGFGLFEGESIDTYTLSDSHSFTWIPLQSNLRFKEASKNDTGLAISLVMGMTMRNIKKDIQNKKEHKTRFSVNSDTLIEHEADSDESPTICKRVQ